jgi:CBS domain-containing protein
MSRSRCPYCGTLNIPGEDNCAECGQPLDDKHLPPPETAVERSMLRDRVHELAPKTPITTPPSTPVGDVLAIMDRHRIGCVVVVEGDKPIGIFSERDALKKIGERVAELAARPVSEFMTQKPETLVADAKIAFAVQRMDLGAYRHLPIVGKQGELVGIISARDILRHLTAELARQES